MPKGDVPFGKVLTTDSGEDSQRIAMLLEKTPFPRHKSSKRKKNIEPTNEEANLGTDAITPQPRMDNQCSHHNQASLEACIQT